jgi:LacI family transcriptional regulator
VVGRPRPPVTISDVAAAAGVSRGTVSKAMNGQGRLTPETRELVQAVALRLGYAPSAAARTLQRGQSYTVGMLTTDSFGRFSIPILAGAEHTLGAGEMSVFLCDARDDPIRERYYVRTLLSHRVDGIIVTGRRTDARPSIGTDLPVPVVYAYMRSSDPDDCSVVPDEAQGVGLALDHLVTVGRRRIAHVTGPRHHLSAQTRAQAGAAYLEGIGLQWAAEPFFGEWSESWGRRAAELVLAANPEVDAVLCGNDQIARGLVDGLKEVGRKVPHDISVVGFDNWDAMALGSRPPLTTVDMDLEGLGRRAAGLLLNAIKGETELGVQAHPCQLVIRDSSAR